MDEFKDGFEGFINEMGKMIFDLLCFLNIKEVQAKIAQPIQVFFFVHLLVFYFLCFQTHITADTSNVRASSHVVIHFVEGLRVGSKTHIKKYRVFGFELVADSVEEPVMGGEFTTIFVLDAKHEIDVSFSPS